MTEEEDYITRRIGIIGKWQWRVLGVMLVSSALGAWQILVSILYRPRHILIYKKQDACVRLSVASEGSH